MSCWRLPALLLSCTSLAVLAGALAMLRALLLSYMFYLTMLAGALVMPWVLLLSYTFLTMLAGVVRSNLAWRTVRTRPCEALVPRVRKREVVVSSKSKRSGCYHVAITLGFWLCNGAVG